MPRLDIEPVKKQLDDLDRSTVTLKYDLQITSLWPDRNVFGFYPAGRDGWDDGLHKIDKKTGNNILIMPDDAGNVFVNGVRVSSLEISEDALTFVHYNTDVYQGT
jgi:hypothetical protein